jgi:hypothetical protein
MAGLAVKRTTKEAWEAIRAMRVGSDRVQKGKVQQQKKEFEMISFRDGESVDDFALRLTNLSQASPRSKHLSMKLKSSRNYYELCRLGCLR